jgi:predicted Rossmann fold flavoprotein
VSFDAIVIGAGAAGLMCALQAGRRGRRVLVVEHNDRIGRKILISGGGRCNFTNLEVSAKNYVSENEHFCKSALSRYAPADFVEMVEKHGIAYHEKKLGQLFCDRSAREIVAMLEKECVENGVEIRTLCRVKAVRAAADGAFVVITERDELAGAKVVVATGGLSIPQIGASDIGYRIARDFGLRVTPLAAALDGFTIREDHTFFVELAGVSLDCGIACDEGPSFEESLLFTHAGLSGPAALQASLHWRAGQSIRLDLLPGFDALDWLLKEKAAGSRKQVKNLLGEKLPARLADHFCARYFPELGETCQAPDRLLKALAEKLAKWEIRPSGTVGYSKAEVTRGGVDTNELSSKTLEAKKAPGLHFIGEVVDVSGWLGGYNFQWAWASGWAAAQAL